MAVTSLPFYRKNQSLYDMENERPKSIEALREAIIKAVEEVEVKLKNIEKEFNGGKTHEAEVRFMVPIMQNMMNVFEWTYMNSTKNIQGILDLTMEPSEVFKVDRFAVQTMKDYYRKLIEFMPGRFEDLIQDVERILKNLSNYCLSFCTKNNLKAKNQYLETPIHYDLKIKEFVKAIRMHIDNIHTMCREIKEDSGVKVKAFGLAANELARACNCGEMPLFLVFPEACYNITNACLGARKWVSEDAIYSTYLQHDILSFDNKRVLQDKKMRLVRDEGIHIEHVIKTIRREVDQLEVEMKKMNKREKQFLTKIESLEMDIKIMEAEIKEKENAREHINEKAEEMTDWSEQDLEDEKEFIASVIARNRINIPETRNKIKTLKNSQQKLIISKRELLNQKYEELKELDKMVVMSKGKVFEAREELRNIEESLGILKDIYMKKTSPDVTKKIYNNMPVQPKNAKFLPKRLIRPAPERDPLDNAAKIVANAIKGDWPKLYRNLPFYPPRGEFDKDCDVDKVFTQKYRGADTVRASESLDKWRRVNSTANLHNLKQTLVKIHRNDILAQVDNVSGKKPLNPIKQRKENWKKLKKFKVTLNKIMDLQARSREHKSDTKSQSTKSEIDSSKNTQSQVLTETESIPKKVQFATKDDILQQKKNKKSINQKSGGKLYLPEIKSSVGVLQT